MVFAGAPAPTKVEFLSFYYAAYIPYLYTSIFLGLVARPPAERDEFVTTFALLYAVGFLGYLFLPARGPVAQLASDFPSALRGGFFHSLILRAIEDMGGPHGAFPSLHVGVSTMVVWFDLRHRNLLRGLIYLPMVFLIAAATVVLRYHWVVDLMAGAALALLANHCAPRLLAGWRRAQPQRA
jgi:membrane-associated phospholipid phosphatase